ncbi:hypothetical protein ACFWRG_19720 [Micromonospora tulbaghiae]|uniref:hypothetical protein n=1 Tax=Micromonospora tulbaghiae TaxID=479978 RepID=UPI0036484D63
MTPERISLSFDTDDACCWLLHYDPPVDEPAEHLADAGVVCQGWTARADGATLEYVVDLTGQC